MSKIALLLGALTLNLLIVFFVHRLGLRGRMQPISAAEIETLSAPYGGAQQWLIDNAGKTAIAMLADSRLLATKIVGEKLATRVYPIDSLAAIAVERQRDATSTIVSMRFGDVAFGPIRLQIVGAGLPVWLEALRHGKDKP